MSVFRVLHTADWHLGKTLSQRSRDAEHRLFLDWLLEVVQQQQIDAVIVAGDIFDTANPPATAQQLYYDFVASLFRLGKTALVVIGGNHDSAAYLEAPRGALRALNVHVVGQLPEEVIGRVIYLPERLDARVAIAALPFLRDRDLRVGVVGETVDQIRAKVVAGIQNRYTETAQAIEAQLAVMPSCPVVATGHLTVVGGLSSESEREIHIGGLGAVESAVFPKLFDYVALGHLHRPQSPAGDPRIRYSGSPIPLSFSEAHDHKEVRIVELQSGACRDWALPIPLWRPLVRLPVTAGNLEAAIAALQVPESPLPAWVEIVVEEGNGATDLVERVRLAQRSDRFEVLRVVRGEAVVPSERGERMLGDDLSDIDRIAALIERPSQLFHHLMNEGGERYDSLRPRLEAAFGHLLELEAAATAEGASR